MNNWEQFANKYNYNADGRKFLKMLENAWAVGVTLALMVGAWASIWFVCIATGYGV